MMVGVIHPASAIVRETKAVTIEQLMVTPPHARVDGIDTVLFGRSGRGIQEISRDSVGWR